MSRTVARPPIVVVVSGHLIDAPDATAPRFPASAERRVAAAIESQFAAWNLGAGDVLITQGARGSDIISAELAAARGAELMVLLASRPDDFVRTSVELPGADWEERFRALLTAAGSVLEQTEELGPVTEHANRYSRNNRWALELADREAKARRGEVRALVVWDQSSDGKPGGTGDFVHQARTRAVPLSVVDPTRVFRYRRTSSITREDNDGPKRLLALDGGGMRGLISLQILRRMEQEIGNGDPEYRLSDTFDYVAGTSTGAIIAAAIARGEQVASIEKMYCELGIKVFRKRWLPARWRSLYRDSSITDVLQGYFGQRTTIGDTSMRTLFMAVTHRADSDSLWPLTNVSTAKYNNRTLDGCNLDFPLWQVIRGSTAAPVFFPPEEFRLGASSGLFQDGGVTPFNNPALLLFEMATSPRYTLGWPTGVDDLLIVSVGTGSAPAVERQLDRRKINLLYHARTLIRTIMNGSAVENDRLCRVLGYMRHGPPIDSEFNDEKVDGIQPENPLFSYVRYNASISATSLGELGPPVLDAHRVAKLDSATAADVEALVRIGGAAAGQVELRHFAGFLP